MGKGACVEEEGGRVLFQKGRAGETLSELLLTLLFSMPQAVGEWVWCLRVSDCLQSFRQKSEESLAAEVVGFPPGTLEALVRFQEEPTAAHLRTLLPGWIQFHLPAGTELPAESLRDEMKLVQDFGLDSLALSEMAFKMEDVFGFRVETHEVFGIESYGELLSFLSNKMELS